MGEERNKRHKDQGTRDKEDPRSKNQEERIIKKKEEIRNTEAI